MGFLTLWRRKQHSSRDRDRRFWEARHRRNDKHNRARAQFAACFSKAWESGAASANVYSLKRDQVSKSKEHGSLGTGSFLLEGEREWFKGVALELAAYMDPEGAFHVVPMQTCVSLKIRKHLLLKPGNTKKSDAAKTLASRLAFDDLDYIMQHLPAGGFSIKET